MGYIREYGLTVFNAYITKSSNVDELNSTNSIIIELALILGLILFNSVLSLNLIL